MALAGGQVTLANLECEICIIKLVDQTSKVHTHRLKDQTRIVSDVVDLDLTVFRHSGI